MNPSRLRVFTLGRLELLAPDGSPLADGLSQKKRIALLTYLAVRAPGGFVPRHAVAALLWPDVPEARARAALRNALHHLRTILGADAIVSRGDEEIALDPAHVWCDAPAFEIACDDDRPAEALALYRGPLLDGFLPPELAEFNDWLDTRRRTLHRRAVDTARTLAERESERSAAAALPWARRWLELAPYEEPAIRALMQLLTSAGDRASALAEYDRWREVLARDLDAEPSRDTVRTAHALQVAAAQQARAAAAAPSVPAVADPGDHSSSDAAPVPARVPRRARIAVVVLVLAAVGAAAGVIARRSGAVGEPVVAVMPFSYSGSAAYDYLGSGMIELFGERFASSALVRPIDSRTIIAGTSAAQGELDEAGGRAVARRFGATHFVLGSVFELDGQLRLSASLYTTDRGRRVAHVTAAGDVGDLFAIVNRASAELLGDGIGDAEPAATRALATSSIPAMEAYLDGERAYIAGRYSTAAEAFRRALSYDSTFARAHLSLSFTAQWIERSTVLRTAIDDAYRYESALSDVDRQLLRAWDAHVGWHPDPQRADSVYRAIVGQHPENAEAWYQLGEVRYHWGPTLGISGDDALAAFEQVLQLMPRHGGALVHAMRLRARNADAAGVDSIGTALRRVGVRPVEDIEARMLARAATNDAAGFLELSAEFWEVNGGAPPLIPLAVNSYRPALIRQLAETYMRRDMTVPARANTRAVIALLNAAEGRFQSAREAAHALDAAAPAWAAEIMAVLLLAPLSQPATTELLDARAAVRRYTSPDGRNSPWAPTATQPYIYHPRALLLDGLLSLRAGDHDAARTIQAALESYSATDPMRVAIASQLARGLRAEMELAAGDAARALRTLGPPRMEADETFPEMHSFGFAHERWVRAQAHERAGDIREALRWYASFPDAGGADLTFTAPAHLRRAALHAQLGDVEAARSNLETLARLWSTGERSAVAILEDARSSLGSSTGPAPGSR